MQVRTPRTELLNAPEFQTVRQAISTAYEKYFNNFENYRPVVLPLEVREKTEEIHQKRVEEIEEEIFYRARQHDCKTCKENLTEIARIIFIDKNGNIVYPLEEAIKEIDERIINKSHSDYRFWKPVLEKVLELQKEYSNRIEGIPRKDLRLTDKNIGLKQVGDRVFKITFYHIAIPTPFPNVDKYPTQDEGKRRYEIMKNIVEKYTPEDFQIALDIINDGLYRGEQFRHMVETLYNLTKEYSQIPEDKKEKWLWFKVYEFPFEFNPMNTAIGYLIEELKDGNTEEAIEKYLKIVSPENYQQIKNREMDKLFVKKAKEELEKRGLIKALYRKVASIEEIPPTEFLYYNAKTDHADMRTLDEVIGVLEEIERESERVRIEDIEKRAKEISFDEIKEIIKGATKVEILLTENLTKNQVVLTKTKYEDAPVLFKWGNNWSWVYKDGFSDAVMTEVKKAVKKHGGQIEAELRISLMWNSLCDFDLHCIDPSGHHIYYNAKKSPTGGMLDVDMNVNDPVRGAIENIFWKENPPEGIYKVWVHNYRKREENDGFTVEIEYKGRIYQFESKECLKHGEQRDVCKFEIRNAELLWIDLPLGEPKIIGVGGDIWGSEIGKWIPVKAILPSPNYWKSTNRVGQEHIIFLLSGIKPTGTVKPFTIDQIDNSLHQYRKFFAVLADKLPITETPDPAVGLGFARGRKEKVFVKVRKDNKEEIYKVSL